GDPSGEFADLGNKDAKLTLEEKDRLARSHFLHSGDGGGRGGKGDQPAEEAKGKKAGGARRENAKAGKSTRRAEEDKRRKEAEAKVAEAKRKAEEAEKLRLAELARKKKQEEDLEQLISEGKAALGAKQFDKAAQAFRKAGQLDANNEDVKRGLAQA